MTITTKFEVNDLVQHKYSSVEPSGSELAYEVLELITQTCYGGTQVFYDCRPIIKAAEKNVFRIEKDITFFMRHGIADTPGRIGSQRFREDELVPCHEVLARQIKGLETSEPKPVETKPSV